MDIATFKRAEKAAHDFIATHGTDHVPYNTLLTLCYIDEKLSPVATGSAHAVAVQKPSLPASAGSSVDAPQWFIDGLTQFAGRKVSSSVILKALGRTADIAASRQAGVWLREIVGEPSRSNGQTVFAIPAKEVHSGAANDEEDEHENPLHPNIPLASRVDYFLSQYQGTFTVQEITKAIGGSDNIKDHHIVNWALKDRKVPQDRDHFIVGLR
ncbi:hypothetical protein [Bradyrhizobium sp. BWC-3-1]|uniref:hypothetical protein n=1 Tax=Bradyrhizobium sp. BWC-3-1 TaxID=3080012 RepID=UPI00293F1092|nr:hypothetical protein [Bradyrhizobium sp. BWC-3-1]WOH61924.1 hypothetical protein RX329_18255 [Bradyrhizobium sp. BWC-3-1]